MVSQIRRLRLYISCDLLFLHRLAGLWAANFGGSGDRKTRSDFKYSFNAVPVKVGMLVDLAIDSIRQGVSIFCLIVS